MQKMEHMRRGVLAGVLAFALATIGTAAADQPTPSDRTIRVADCGAIGDGKHDDAPAIQKALDSGSAIVIIPPGVYRVNQALRIGSGTTLKVDPKAVIRLADDAGNHASVFILTNRNPGNGNANITVEGGIWDGNNEHNRRGKDGDLFAYTGVAINFVNVKHLVLRNLTVKNPDSFSIRVGEVEDFLVEDITLDHPVIRPNQDGIHVGGYSQRGIIRRVKGVTPNTPADDMIAINADDDVERVLNLGMRRGPIRDILVEDIEADNAYNFVRILSTTSTIDGITVRRVAGSCSHYAVNINEWRFPAGSGDIRNVLLEHFNVSKTAGQTTPLIDIALKVRNLQISDFVRTDSVSVPTLRLRNGLNNLIRLDDDSKRSVSTFSIPSGGIGNLWIDRPEPPR